MTRGPGASASVAKYFGLLSASRNARTVPKEIRHPESNEGRRRELVLDKDWSRLFFSRCCRPEDGQFGLKCMSIWPRTPKRAERKINLQVLTWGSTAQLAGKSGWWDFVTNI